MGRQQGQRGEANGEDERAEPAYPCRRQAFDQAAGDGREDRLATGQGVISSPVSTAL